MKQIALIFPGQGAQQAGMGLDLYENSTAAKHVFETAKKVMGFDVALMCFSGSSEELMKTINSQPCIVTVEIAALEALREKTNLKIQAVAGHSLGEYSALYAAGAIDLATVFKLIKKRAELMSELAEKTDGMMAAVLGLELDVVDDIVNNLEGVYVANFNSSQQVVITGKKDSIESSLERFKEAGAKRVIPLAVSGAFHSPLMKEAGEKFVDYVKDFTFNDTQIPVYTNVDAFAHKKGSVFREQLPKQIYSSVLWTQIICNMKSAGINDFIEIGPGKVLAGLNKKINPELNTLNIYDWSSLENSVNELKEKELV